MHTQIHTPILGYGLGFVSVNVMYDARFFQNALISSQISMPINNMLSDIIVSKLWAKTYLFAFAYCLLLLRLNAYP